MPKLGFLVTYQCREKRTMNCKRYYVCIIYIFIAPASLDLRLVLT